jgi:hypothetical protein
VRFCISGAQETETGLYEIFVFGDITGYRFDPRPINKQKTTAQLHDPITLVITPELAVTIPARLRAHSSVATPELAVTALAELQAPSNVKGNLNPPQPQMRDSEARRQLPELDLAGKPTN